VGSGQWAVGSGQWAVGSGQWAGNLRGEAASSTRCSLLAPRHFLSGQIAEVPPANCSNSGVEFGARDWGGNWRGRGASKGNDAYFLLLVPTTAIVVSENRKTELGSGT
jgi:hypothetical protein